MKVKKNITTIILLMFSANLLYATHPLITDDTGVQGKGKSQIEFVYEYGNDKDSGTEVEEHDPSVTFSYGVDEKSDIVFGLPYVYVKEITVGNKNSESGISDIYVEYKRVFYSRDGLSVALKPGIVFATGDEDKGLGNGKAGYYGYVIVSKEIDNLSFHFNAGYIYNNNSVGDRKDILHFSLASMFSLNDKSMIVSNVGAERNTDSSSKTYPAFFILGYVYTPFDWLDLDVGYKFPINDVEMDKTYMFGITGRF